MSVTTSDQHVNEAPALITPTHPPATATRPARSADAPQHGRTHLALVRLLSSHEKSRK
ncbi:hypothetical protein [Streptomyces clavuligerus]|uniref:hypothetical protein n=1 Tax=Streptomyces clavuligerus TaxID=1901 RepID=UPI0001852206|nr:hypothetical protein [Streptomyces clavuligerus]WDN56232.1 hypothetical protein LL058_30765 [Streptomyces clavuligerus]